MVAVPRFSTMLPLETLPVPILIVLVPEEEPDCKVKVLFPVPALPIVSAVAAPKAVTVVGVPNSVNVEAFPFTAGAFRFKVVPACTVDVPADVEPRVMVVAAPPMLRFVDAVLKAAMVAGPTSPVVPRVNVPFIVVVAEDEPMVVVTAPDEIVAVPMFMAIEPVETLPVPILIVLVPVFALACKVKVLFPLLELPIARVVAAPKALTVVLVVLKTSIEAEPITDVAKVGEVARTTFPEPVFVVA